jgi:lipopolysaccharide/colanic/teichoic acid biosynthesis glycosyltransferase
MIDGPNPLRQLVRQHGRLKLALATGDIAIAAGAAFWAARAFEVSTARRFIWIVALTVATIPILRALGCYKYRIYAGPWGGLARLSVGAFALWTFGPLLVGRGTSLLLPSLWSTRLATAAAVTGAGWWLVRQGVKWLLMTPIGNAIRRRVVIVALGPEGAAQGRVFAAGCPPDAQIVETMTTNGAQPEPEVFARRGVDEWMLVAGDLPQEDLLKVFDQMLALPVKVGVLAPAYAVVAQKGWEQEYSHFLRVPLNRGIQSDFYRRHAKPIIDRLGAAILIALLSPVLLFLALLVKVTSPGPVFYRADSIGKDLRPFRMLKFRTMHVGSSDQAHRSLVRAVVGNPDHRLGKLRDDPRITPLGRYLRRYSLDELPQLFNVVAGEMSLVGPRPSKPYEVERSADWHRRRFELTPGMTGIWQVSGRAEVSYNEMVMLDLFYGQNCSFWLDLRILLQTIRVVVRGTGGS